MDQSIDQFYEQEQIKNQTGEAHGTLSGDNYSSVLNRYTLSMASVLSKVPEVLVGTAENKKGREANFRVSIPSLALKHSSRQGFKYGSVECFF